MSTSIKRLKQNGVEFVPITLSEAVVVNGKYIWNQDTITTLDNVLKTLFGTNANLEKLIEQLNTQISNKQDTLTAGEGISINVVNGKTVISSNQSLYKIVSQLPLPTAECLNKIYLVGTADNQMVEYICVQSETTGSYYFEQIGLVQVQENIDLSGYVTSETFNQSIGSINTKLAQVEDNVIVMQNELSSLKNSFLVVEDVTTSDNRVVSVDYEIPLDLYDSAVDIEEDRIV